jgi:CRP-like cAMP-binding protein
MENASSLWYFESVNLFNILCPHKVKRMALKHEFKSYQRDEYIYFPDQAADYIYMVVSGRVKVGHYTSEGNEIIKAILTSGEIFGELALAGEERRMDYAQALDNKTTICPLSIGELKDLMKQDKELSFRILKLVGLKLMRMERKLESLVFKDVRTRVIEFLKDTAALNGRKVGYETMIATRLTHRDIAALTGTSRQTVTTILNELRDKNLIYFDRKKILIRDLSKLC